MPTGYTRHSSYRSCATTTGRGASLAPLCIELMRSTDNNCGKLLAYGTQLRSRITPCTRGQTQHHLVSRSWEPAGVCLGTCCGWTRVHRRTCQCAPTSSHPLSLPGGAGRAQLCRSCSDTISSWLGGPSRPRQILRS